MNNQDANVVTLHTAPGRRGSTACSHACTYDEDSSKPKSRAMTGLSCNEGRRLVAKLYHSSLLRLNCNAATNNNAGCGVSISGGNSYGSTFNSHGGGWCYPFLTSVGLKLTGVSNLGTQCSALATLSQYGSGHEKAHPSRGM